jgi:hypothetical protein
MEDMGIDAMFTFTVMMGFTALMMAWIMIVVAVKGWAVRWERKSSFSGAYTRTNPA